MVATSASVIIADDIRLEINQKLIIIGVYTGDVIVPAFPFDLGPLRFFFTAFGELEQKPNTLAFEVEMPDGNIVGTDASAGLDLPTELTPAGRTKWMLRSILISPPTRITESVRLACRAIADDVEVSISSPWVVLPTQVTGWQALSTQDIKRRPKSR